MQFKEGDYVGQVIYRFDGTSWVVDSVVVMPADTMIYNSETGIWQQVRKGTVIGEWEEDRFIVPVRLGGNRPLCAANAERLNDGPRLSEAENEIVRKLLDE